MQPKNGKMILFRILNSYVVGQCLHAAWETLGVGLKSSELVPRVRQPTVVHVDVGVSRVSVALRGQDIRHLMPR